MAREFSVIVSIDASRARAGGRQFKQGADQVARSSARMRRGMDRTRRSATALITTIGRMRGVATLAFAGFLGVGGLGSIVRTIAQFETAMARVNALMGDRGTTGVMAALTEKARELGATTLFTATEAAEGMRFLTLAGFDALEVYQAIEPALNLATAGMLGLGEAADIVSNIMAAFRIDAEDTEMVVDALAFTAARTNTDIRQLGQAMKFVGPIAGTLGIDVRETAVALGILGNSGLQASLAGTSLRRVMSGLLNPSRKAKLSLAAMGLTAEELVEKMTGENGLVEVIKALAKAGLDAGDAFLLFGQRGAPGVLSLITQKDKLEAFTAAVKEMGGEAKRQAAIIQDTLGGDARIAISALQESILQLGDSGLGDFLREATQGFIGFIRGLSGIKTPLDEMSASMLVGEQRGMALANNLDLLRQAMITLVVYMNRSFLVTLGRMLVSIGALALSLGPKGSLARNLIATRAGAIAAAGGLAILKRAIATTLIGALIVAVGWFISWATSSDDATESTETFTESITKLNTEADKLVFTFDLVSKVKQKIAIRALQESLEGDRKSMAKLTAELDIFNRTSIATALAKDQLAMAEVAAASITDQSSQAYIQAAATVDAWKSSIAGADLALAKMNSDGQIDILEATLEDVNKRIAEGEINLTGMKLVLENSVSSLKAYRDSLLEVADAQSEADDKLVKLIGLTNAQATAFQELVDDANPASVAVEELAKKFELFNLAGEKREAIMKKLQITDEEWLALQKLLAFQMKEATEELNDQQKAVAKNSKEFKKLLGELDPVVKLEQEFEEQLKVIVTELMNGEISLIEYRDAILAVKDALQENKIKLENQCNEVKKLEECMTDAAKAMDTIWDQALRNIQDAFADAFEGAFDSFEDFASNLLDAFKTLIANILAEAAILNIFGKGNGFFADVFSGFSQGFGGGVADTVGSTVSGASGGTGATGFSGMAAAWSGFTASVGAFFTGAGSFLSGAGSLAGASGAVTPGAVSVFNTGAQNAAIANPTAFGAGGVVSGAGIGALTGAVTDAILGGRGDPTRNAIFSAIGGAIGSIWGPIGSVIGGAIGSFVDNLFGGAKKLESAVIELEVQGDNFFGTQTDIVSKQRSFFRGKKLTTTTTDLNAALNDIEAVFKALGVALEEGAAALGADASGFLDDFSASLELDIRNLSSAQITAAMTSFFERTMNAAITEWLNDVEGLSDDARTILMSFRTTVEGFVIALDSLGSLENLFNIDLVDTVTSAVEESQIGIFEAYQNALSGYREIIASYDGSIESIELLTNATAIMIQVQLDLVAIYLATGEAISNMFMSSAQQIRESLLSDEELFNLRQEQIDDLIMQASMTTDPEELARIADEINSLGLDAFNLLTPEQQQALGPEFIEFFENMDEFFGGQINEGIEGILADQAALDEEVSNRMLEAAEALLETARIQQEREDRRREDREFGDRDFLGRDEMRA